MAMNKPRWNERQQQQQRNLVALEVTALALVVAVSVTLYVVVLTVVGTVAADLKVKDRGCRSYVRMRVMCSIVRINIVCAPYIF